MFRNTKLYSLFRKRSWPVNRLIGTFAKNNLYDESVSHIFSVEKTPSCINKEKFVGIDFGTTNTRVAVSDKNGFKVLKETRSLVYTIEDGEIVDENTEWDIYGWPWEPIKGVKKLLFGKFDDKDVQEYMKTTDFKVVKGPKKRPLIKLEKFDRLYKPCEAAAPLLRNMKKSADLYFNEEVNNAVIAVPTGANDFEELKEAGRLAGFERIDVVKEPIAAVLALDSLDSQESTSGDKVTAVYDFGDDKFEVSIIKSKNGRMHLYSYGDLMLNGRLVDNVLINYFNQKLREQNGDNIEKSQHDNFLLRDHIADAKMELCNVTKVNINFHYHCNGHFGHFEMELTRKELENRTDELLRRTIPLCEKSMKRSGISKKDIDEVLLVGGMTKMPKVKEVVEELFGKAPNNKIDPREILAIGAAAAARRSKYYFE